jgi:stage II sporulation protein D
MFKLRSTIATISVADGNISIDTKGYGHRVGMSQHGANVMAKQEIEYRDILKYYYTDVEIASYSSKTNTISS